MFYFNWYEILAKARKDQTAILILTFAQTSLYNPYTTKGLMKALKINHIPIHLFTWGILEQKRDSLVCHYKTQEPMSYMKNPYFMTQNVSIIKKTEYIQMLSMRRISEKHDYIQTIITTTDIYKLNNIGFDFNSKENNIYELKKDETYSKTT